jgi:alkylhydroperoxidase/carboxymuconolactone decarboxylase family protein YurZ
LQRAARRSTLDRMAFEEKDRRLARLFAAVVLGRWEDVVRTRRDAPEGEPDRAWREAVLQAHVFAGFPRVVEAYGVFETCGGLGALEPGEELGEADQPQRGRELFERIYADQAPRVRDVLVQQHPDFAAWIEGHAYGRVLARPGLTPARRELLAIVALAALGQERQLASHVRGALRCGATSADVHAALDAVLDLIGPERHAAARRIAARFTATA